MEPAARARAWAASTVYNNSSPRYAHTEAIAHALPLLSASASSSNLAISVCPSSSACSRAFKARSERPERSKESEVREENSRLKLSDAPCCSNAITISRWPTEAATISGVHTAGSSFGLMRYLCRRPTSRDAPWGTPYQWLGYMKRPPSGHEPAASSADATSAWPWSAAKYNAVCPYSSIFLAVEGVAAAAAAVEAGAGRRVPGI